MVKLTQFRGYVNVKECFTRWMRHNRADRSGGVIKLLNVVCLEVFIEENEHGIDNSLKQAA